MRRIIKYSVIKEINEYLKKEISNLKQEQSKLLLDISKINECYQGKDASIIVSKYTESANQLSIYITNVENYIKYFDWLCGNYHKSQKKAMSNLTNAIPQGESETLIDTTLNLDNIITFERTGDSNGY